MKRFLQIYLLICIAISATSYAILGSPGILTGFGSADSSGKGGSNLPPAAMIITVPLDVITAPFQSVLLVPAAKKRIESNQRFEDDARYVEVTAADPRAIADLIIASRTRELTDVEKRALKVGWRDPNFIPTDQIPDLFHIFRDNGSAIAVIMKRRDIAPEHLQDLYQQAMGDEHSNSRVLDELADHEATPEEIITTLAEDNYIGRRIESR